VDISLLKHFSFISVNTKVEILLSF